MMAQDPQAPFHAGMVLGPQMHLYLGSSYGNQEFSRCHGQAQIRICKVEELQGQDHRINEDNHEIQREPGLQVKPDRQP